MSHVAPGSRVSLRSPGTRVMSYVSRATEGRPGTQGLPLEPRSVDHALGSGPGDPIAELDRLFLIRRQRHIPGHHAALVLDVAPRWRRAALQFDLDRVILRHRDLIEHAQLDRALVQILHRDAIVAHIGLRGRDQSGFAALVLDDRVAYSDQ